VPLAGTRLGGADLGGGLLATELDPPGLPHELSVLSTVAWIHFGRRCLGAEANGEFHLDAFAARFRPAISHFGAGVVAV